MTRRMVGDIEGAEQMNTPSLRRGLTEDEPMKVKMTADARIAPHGDTVKKGMTVDVPDDVAARLIEDKKAKRMVARGANVKSANDDDEPDPGGKAMAA